MKKLLLILLCLMIFCSTIATAEGMSTVKIDCGYRHVVVLNEYGRVYASGYNVQNQCEVYGWKNVIDVSAGKYFTAALFEDGTVAVTGKDESGNYFETDNLCNIVKIDAGDNFLAALDGDGYVHIVGDTTGIDVSEWNNIAEIAAGSRHIAGLTSEGECFLSGVGIDNVADRTNIERIYSGANLTVMIDTDGKLYKEGIATYDEGSEEEGGIWIPSSWTGSEIKKIEIVKGSSENGVVVALLNDNTVVSDGINEQNWITDCSQITGAKDISVLDSCEYQGIVAIAEDMKMKTYGSFSENKLEATDWKKEVESINVNREPIELKEKTTVAVGYNNIGIVLPDNTLKVFGEGSGEGIENVVSFTYVMNKDNYVYTDKQGVIRASITVADETPINYTWNTTTDLLQWKNTEKIATYWWDGSDELITALRWDGKIYSTNKNDSVTKEKTDAIDIVGGKYFTATLNRDKTVSVFATQNVTDNFASVSQWTGIEKIYAGFNQLIGIKADGTCVAAGGSKDSNGDYAECQVEEWTDIVSATGGEGFSVGLKSDGTCVVAARSDVGKLLGRKAQVAKTEIESWTDIKELYKSYTGIIGYKNDGTYEVHIVRDDINKVVRPEYLNMKKVYYKDDTFWYNASEGNVAKIEYISDEELTAYMTYFDGEGVPVKYDKVTLEPSNQLATAEYNCEYAETCAVEIGGATADKLSFYMEQEEIKNGIKISYCADKETIAYVTYFDAEGIPIKYDKVVLVPSNQLTSAEFTCENAETAAIAIGKATADKLSFYMENEEVENGVKISHCADSPRRVTVAFYDNNNVMKDVKVKTLQHSNEMTENVFTCEGASKYKIMMWDGATPLYKAEGIIN